MSRTYVHMCNVHTNVVWKEMQTGKIQRPASVCIVNLNITRWYVRYTRQISETVICWIINWSSRRCWMQLIILWIALTIRPYYILQNTDVRCIFCKQIYNIVCLDPTQWRLPRVCTILFLFSSWFSTNRYISNWLFLKCVPNENRFFLVHGNGWLACVCGCVDAVEHC